MDAVLVSPAPADHAGRRLNEQLDVGPKVLVPQIPQIHAHPILESDLAAATDLPQASEPGLHGKRFRCQAS